MGTFDNTTQKTFQATAELPVPSFKRIKLVIANANTSARNIGGASIAALANKTDLNGASATHVKVTFGGADTGVVPAASSSLRRAFLISDWIDIASLPRDDGGTLALLLSRIYESTSGTINVLGNGTSDNYANWATRTDGNLWAMRYNDGNCCQGTGTPANFSSTTARIQCGIAGFIFETANGEKVCTIAGFGDSITEGRGTYINEGWGLPACDLLHAANPSIYFSWCNLGWSGQVMSNVDNNQLDAFSAGLLPNLCFFPNGSPNDASGDNNISDAEVSGMLTRRDNMKTRCLSNGVHFVVWTWLPTNPTVAGFDWGATDSKRVAHNAATLADGIASGYTTADFSAALSGVTDGDGQVNMLVGSTTDNIHPNDVGNATLAALAAVAAPLALARVA